MTGLGVGGIMVGAIVIILDESVCNSGVGVAITLVLLAAVVSIGTVGMVGIEGVAGMTLVSSGIGSRFSRNG